MSFDKSFFNRSLLDKVISNHNRMCDYIELQCLISQDKIISKDDVIAWFNEECEDDGTEMHADLSDRRTAKIESYFEQISFRSKATGDYYPFTYDNECLIVSDVYSLEQLQYIVLLLSSNFSAFDKSSAQLIATYFEDYCLHYFSCLVPANATNYIFGTSRSGGEFTGNLRSRIEKLAKHLNAQTTKTFDNDPKYDVSAGDGGLDLISILKIDEATHLPVALGQCTCSYDKWEGKQMEISQERWGRRLDPLAPISQFVFVPFFCRDAGGKFEKPTMITTCLIDRLRFMKLLKMNESLIDDIDYKQQLELIESCCNSELRDQIQQGLQIT